MNDCMNAEIRDQLPELVHDRLDAARRAEILLHVEACAECRDEIELLRAARAMFDAQTPRVDVRYVVNALPLAKPRPVGVQRGRAVWTDWRIAAAITLLVAGGSSVAVLRRDPGTAMALRQTVQTPPVRRADGRSDSSGSSAQPQLAPAAPSEPTPRALVATDAQGSGIGASRLGDLTEQQLEALLGEIDQLQATPVTDPEPVSLHVRENTSGAPEGA
jgi:putative zinc finger protein